MKKSEYNKILATAKKIIKSAVKNQPHISGIHGLVQKDGYFYLTDYCRLIRLPFDLPEIERAGYGDTIDLNMPLRQAAEEAPGGFVSLPTVKQLKTWLKVAKALNLQLDFAFEETGAAYNGKYLLEMLEAIPDCKMYKPKNRLSATLLQQQLEYSNSTSNEQAVAGIIMPLRMEEEKLQKLIGWQRQVFAKMEQGLIAEQIITELSGTAEKKQEEERRKQEEEDKKKAEKREAEYLERIKEKQEQSKKELLETIEKLANGQRVVIAEQDIAIYKDNGESKMQNRLLAVAEHFGLAIPIKTKGWIAKAVHSLQLMEDENGKYFQFWLWPKSHKSETFCEFLRLLCNVLTVYKNAKDKVEETVKAYGEFKQELDNENIILTADDERRIEEYFGGMITIDELRQVIYKNHGFASKEELKHLFGEDKKADEAPKQVSGQNQSETVLAKRTAKKTVTNIQKKAVEIAKQYENLSLQDKIKIIAQAFGCTTGKIEICPCQGKWRGSSDIYIRFDNGVALGIGNDSTPKAKTKKIQNMFVNATLQKYNLEIISATKEAAMLALREREIKDNEIAIQKGLKPYTLLNVEFKDSTDDTDYIGWYYVTLAIDGKIRAHMESGLNYEIASGKVTETSTRENYFIAGGLQEAEVDYIFNNVGFSTNSGMYSLPINKEALKRAENAIIERTETGPEPSTTNEKPLPGINPCGGHKTGLKTAEKRAAETEKGGGIKSSYNSPGGQDKTTTTGNLPSG